MNLAHNSWPVPDANRTPQGWGYPTNLGPVSAATHARGQNRTNNEAEEILASAIAYWDVSKYRDEDRFLRNQGTGGSVLDLRLGSSSEPNTNDPKYLAPEDSGYVYLPGSGVNRPTVPTSTSFNVTDLDIQAYVNLETWRPSAQGGLAGRYSGTASTSSWYFALNTDGTVSLFLSDGLSFRNGTSTAAVDAGFANLWIWVRATYLASTGGVSFYTSPDGSTWTQLGSTRTVTTGTPNASTEDLAFGSFGTGYTNQLAGRYGRFLFLNGINGTTVLDINCDVLTSGGQSNFTAVTGQTVSIIRSTSGRKSVAMPSKKNNGRPCMLLGTDDFLNLDASQSALVNPRGGDSLTALLVLRQWATPLISAAFIGTRNAIGVNLGGWQIRNNSTTLQVQGTIVDTVGNGSGLSISPGATFTAGTLIAPTLVLDRTAGVSTMNSIATSATSNIRYQSISPPNTLRVGCTPDGFGFNDFEFRAAAVFRRALTAREINILNNYFSNDSTKFYQPSKATQIQNIANQFNLNTTTDAALLDILSDATLLIDAKKSTAGERYMKNYGLAGDLLNLRYGSSNVANTNDPLLLTPETNGYVYLPGVAGNHLSVPNEAAFTVTNLDIRMRVRPDNWSPSAIQHLASRWDTTTWRFWMETNGAIRLMWVDSSATQRNVQSSSLSLAPGEAAWIRCTLQVDNGSGGHTVSFYKAADASAMPTSWTLVSSGNAGAFTTAIRATSDQVRVGARDSSDNLAGRAYRFVQLSDIGGTTVLDIDCNVITSGGQTTFTASTGQQVSINRATSGRKTVAMPNTTSKKWDDANIYLPGVASNYLSVPDEAALDITGDLDLRLLVALDSWTPVATSDFMAKWIASQQSYYFQILSTGRLRLNWTTNGSTTISKDSTVSVPGLSSQPLWVRVTLTVNNGASGNDVNFYTSLDGTTWTQLGTTVTTAGATSIFSGTSGLSIGAYNTGTGPIGGKLYRAQVLNGISGSTVLDINTASAPSNFVAGSTASFTAVTGQTVTLNSTASSGMAVRGIRNTVGKPTMLFGTDDYLEIDYPNQNEFLNLKQGQPFTLISSYRILNIPSVTQTIIGKGINLNANAGATYTILSQSTAVAYRFSMWDGVGTARTVQSTGPIGLINQVTGRLSPSLEASVFINENKTVTGTWLDAQVLASPYNFKIGVAGDNIRYADFEFRGAGLWRRSLTEAEITTLTNSGFWSE